MPPTPQPPNPPHQTLGRATQVLQSLRWRCTPDIPTEPVHVSLDVTYDSLPPANLVDICDISDARDVTCVAPSCAPAKFVLSDDLVVHGGTCVVEVAHRGIPIAVITPGDEIHLDCAMRILEVPNAVIVPRVEGTTLRFETTCTRTPYGYLSCALDSLLLDIQVLTLRLEVLGGRKSSVAVDERLLARGQDRFVVSFASSDDPSVFQETMLVRGRGSNKLVGSLFASIMRALPWVQYAASTRTTYPIDEEAELAIRVDPESGRTALEAALETVGEMRGVFERMRGEAAK